LPYLCVTLKELSVSDVTTLAFETNCHIFDGCGFPAPGLHSFLFKPLIGDGGGSVYFNKTMLLALLGSIVIVGFFWAAFAKPKIVPGKLQMVAEAGYDFVLGLRDLRNLDWVDLPTSHWPMWSKPRELAEIIGRVASEHATAG